MKESVIFYGDSNTFGFNSAGYCDGGFRGTFFHRKDTWAGRLAASPLLAEMNVVNAGENGRMIPTAAWELRELTDIVSRNAPVRLVGVMLGSNDLLTLYRCDMEKLSDRMEGVLRHLLSLPEIAGEGGRLLLIAPTHTELPGYREEELEFNRLSEGFGETYRALAGKYGTHFADAGEWGIPLSSDGVHFTAEGHRIFAENLLRVLQAIL
ncbi:MAG: arylesterase [Lachnospiraceae bacterium]|nr:arylesterase [Lachnospiraceae bacterium]